MGFISRGFQRRQAPAAPSDRVPPGQYVTQDFPVLSAGPTPRVGLEAWQLELIGEVDRPRSWNWQEFTALPAARRALSRSSTMPSYSGLYPLAVGGNGSLGIRFQRT